MAPMVHKVSLVPKDPWVHPDPLVQQARLARQDLRVNPGHEDPRAQRVIRALRARKALRGLKEIQASWAQQARRERKAQQVQSVIQGLQEPRAQKALWAQWEPPVPKDQPAPKE
jgi:hypothetical protein